jgi:hypothetical protein
VSASASYTEAPEGRANGTESLGTGLTRRVSVLTHRSSAYSASSRAASGALKTDAEKTDSEEGDEEPSEEEEDEANGSDIWLCGLALVCATVYHKERAGADACTCARVL